MASGNTIFTRSFNLLWIANFLIAVAFYFLISSLPIYMTSVLKTGKTETGLVLASYTLASLIIRLFAGWAIDSLGRKLIYIIALAAFAIIFNAYILAITVGIMLFIRILHGLAW
jgi:MFS family permease